MFMISRSKYCSGLGVSVVSLLHLVQYYLGVDAVSRDIKNYGGLQILSRQGKITKSLARQAFAYVMRHNKLQEHGHMSPAHCL